MRDKFVILHIARIKNEPSNGVQIVVPQHIKAQGKYAKVALLNIEDKVVPGVEFQFQLPLLKKNEKIMKSFNQLDMVVFHEVYYGEYIKIAKQLKRRNIPYVIVAHGALTKDAQSKNNAKKKLANLLVFNRFIRNSKAIQCLSKAEFEEVQFASKFIGTNGVVCPNKKKVKFSNEEINIVYIGRLDLYYKGIDLLIDAVNKCKNVFELYKCKLHIYGPDKNGRKKKIEELIQQADLENILLLHEGVFGAEKEKILLNTDYFIQTSRTEGMPIGILEALSYGVPCIVTEGTRLAGIIEKYNAGWNCETNVEKIAEAIVQAIKEKDSLAEKSSNARKLVANEFDWDQIAQATVSKYRLLSERK